MSLGGYVYNKSEENLINKLTVNEHIIAATAAATGDANEVPLLYRVTDW